MGHKEYMNIALDLARESEHNFKHAAVIVKGNKILGTAQNKYCNRSVPGIGSIHAEEKCIKKCTFKDLKGSNIYIARIASYGPALSKPCSRCQLVLKSVGISKVFFSNNQTCTGIDTMVL